MARAKSNARQPHGASQHDQPWDGQDGHEDGHEDGHDGEVKEKCAKIHARILARNLLLKNLDTFLCDLDLRHLHLQGAVGLAAHGEQERGEQC